MSRIALGLFVVGCWAGAASPASAYQTPPAAAVQNGFTQLTFSDDFTDGSLDAVWRKQNLREDNGQIRPFIREEAVAFHREFERSEPQRLVLLAYRKRIDGNREWVAGRIDTRPRFDAQSRPIHAGFEHRYGYIEARIRFKTRPGQLSAFWLNSRWNTPDNWRGPGDNDPAINHLDRDFNRDFGNEVDIVESVKRHTPRSVDRFLACGGQANEQIREIDAKRCLLMNIHWGGGPHNDNRRHGSIGKHANVHWNAFPLPLIDNYHTYGLLWRTDRYEFYLDGTKMWETDNPAVVSHRPAFLLLTTGVNNSDFVGTPDPDDYSNRDDTRARMEVEWVRWWSNTPRVAPSPN